MYILLAYVSKLLFSSAVNSLYIYRYAAGSSVRRQGQLLSFVNNVDDNNTRHRRVERFGSWRTLEVDSSFSLVYTSILFSSKYCRRVLNNERVFKRVACCSPLNVYSAFEGVPCLKRVTCIIHTLRKSRSLRFFS